MALKEPKSKKIKMQEYVINTMNNLKEDSSNWSGRPLFTEILIKYYSLKFKKSCILVFPEIEWYTNENETKYTVFYVKPEDINKDGPIIEMKKKVLDFVSKISECMQKKGKNISIAIHFPFYFLDLKSRSIAGHRNLLIFKPYKNTLEWFEPHGKKFMGIDSPQSVSNEVIVRYFIKCLEEDKSIDCKSIQLVLPEDNCPYFGLQGREIQSSLPNLSGGGYCVLWSFLIMKLSLKYPYKSLYDIVKGIQLEYKDKDQLRKLMYAFSNEISDIFLKNYNVTLNELIPKTNQSDINKIIKEYDFNDKQIVTSSQYSKSD